MNRRRFTLPVSSGRAGPHFALRHIVLILGVTSPNGETHNLAAAFPSGCGKTSLATMAPTLPGWKVEALGDDIEWLQPGDDGRLWAECERRVPISAIVLGGRRAKLTPLVHEARSWRHGIYIGATMITETMTVTGAIGTPRYDPMAMLPDPGSNYGAYFERWLELGRKLDQPPKIFHVNWYRTADDGRLLWPGFDENIRVLKWIHGRVNGTAKAQEVPIGFVPDEGDFDLAEMDFPKERLTRLLAIDSVAWLRESGRTLEYLDSLGAQLPVVLLAEHRFLVRRLQDAARRSLRE